ncbi:hypothetical protein Pfo_001941 [Paulownia fortunei]|nr:hypothetical protein Pfo_001941 [Paulownia fortunei]
MNKQDMLKIQTCVLRVDIHCDGCKHKVKNKLQKIEGVCKVNIDVEQGKVTVSGNVDPATLMKKLEKAGKHAELWRAQKGPIPIMNNQFKNIQIEKTNGGKDSKTQKGGKDQQKDVKGQHKAGFQAPQQMHQKKGSKDARFLGKDQSSVRFNLPEDEEDDFHAFDEDDDEFDDEFDEGFAAYQPPSQVPPVAGRGGHGPQANKATPNGHLKGNNGANNGGNGKKGSGIHMFLKGMLGKAGGRNGNVGKSHNRAGNQNEGGKNSGKNGGFVSGEGKNGAINGKGASLGGGGKNNAGWSKKVGEDFDGGLKSGSKQLRFNEIDAYHKGGGGRTTGLIGQVGDFQAVQSLPGAAAMNVGHLQGAGQGNPYNQQYMAHMMMMNQQSENRHDTYQPFGYTRSQPAMSYGPPLVADQYTHIFSDENTSSCNIM